MTDRKMTVKGLTGGAVVEFWCWTRPKEQRDCKKNTGASFKCGQAGHLQRDCKKNTGASSSGHADKKPDAPGRVFALTQDQAANTS
ncbi:putative reverse transcriptase domain-containing protein, partial [Tanacetum coccineum]